MTIEGNMKAIDPSTPRLKLADWLWRPWYAKMWWTAIPVWWLGKAASTQISMLENFYESALSGYLNILFFPMTALMVLGVGFARRWLDQFQFHSFKEAVDGEDHGTEGRRFRDPFDVFPNGRPGQPHWSVDIFDPHSGSLYIGSPLNPLNGTHISTNGTNTIGF